MSDTAENVENQDVEPVVADQVEVVSDGDTPTPETIPLSSHLHQKNKWKQREESKRQELSSKDAEIELLKLRNQQLSDQSQKPQTVKRPKIEDFDTDEEYDDAIDAWHDQRAEAKASAAIENYDSTRKKTREQIQLEEQNDKALDSYYEKAQALNASDFSDSEDRVIEAFGKDTVLAIIKDIDGSENLIYNLGNDKAAIARFLEMKNSPIKFVSELTKYAEKNSNIKTSNPPPPDEADTVIGQVGSIDAKLAKLRAKRDKAPLSEKTAIMNEIIALKRQG